MKKDSRLERAGVSGYNRPKKTPGHPTKSHIVVAKDGDQVKTIRFGQQGVSGSPEGSARNKSFNSNINCYNHSSSNIVNSKHC